MTKFIIIVFASITVSVDANDCDSWTRILTGEKPDKGTCIVSLTDGFLVGGNSESGDGDYVTSEHSGDFFLARYSKNGQLKWIQKYPYGCWHVNTERIAVIDSNCIVCLDGRGNAHFLNARGYETHTDTLTDGYVYGIVKTADGNIAYTYLSEGRYYVAKIDKYAKLIWRVRLDSCCIPVTGISSTTNDGGVIISGVCAVQRLGAGGESMWIKRFQGAHERIWVKEGAESTIDIAFTNINGIQIIVRYSKDWDIKWSVVQGKDFEGGYRHWDCNEHGDVYLAGESTDTVGTTDKEDWRWLAVVKINKEGYKEWEEKVNIKGYDTATRGMIGGVRSTECGECVVLGCATKMEEYNKIKNEQHGLSPQEEFDARNAHDVFFVKIGRDMALKRRF